MYNPSKCSSTNVSGFACRATFALTAAAGTLASALAVCCLPETRRPAKALSGDSQVLPFADRDFESETLLAGSRVAQPRARQLAGDQEQSGRCG